MSREGPWPVVLLRRVLTRRRDWIQLEDDRLYRRLTARVRNQGIGPRDEVLGAKVRVKRQQAARGGDLLVAAIDAKVGGFGIVPAELGGAIVSGHYFLYGVDARRITLPWLDEMIRAGWLQRQVIAVGSTNYAAIRADDVLAFRLPVPPVSEQRAIADLLGRLNAARAATRAIVDDLRAAKRWTLRRLLTEGLAEKRHAMAPLPRPWRMGRVAPGVTHTPAGWRLVRLTDFARLESGHTPSRKHPEYWGGDIPWLSLADAPRLKRLAIDDADGRITQAGIDNSSTRILPTGTVLVLRTGGSRGACARLGRSMATDQNFAGFVCGPGLLPGYLQQCLKHITDEWERLSDGSTSLKAIYLPVFKKLQILLPPIDEQRSIAAVGEAFDARIAAESAALDRLTALKQGLARELLSGRLRVPPALVARLADGDGGG